VDVRDTPNFSASKDEMQAAKTASTKIKTTNLKSSMDQTPDEDKMKKEKFNATVDSLIKALDAAITKHSL
jgi:hypothetical protein